MWMHVASLTVLVIASLGVTVALFVAAIRVVHREDGVEWVGSPTLNGSPGGGRRSGKLRRAA
jgi:hypothetical protein